MTSIELCHMPRTISEAFTEVARRRSSSIAMQIKIEENYRCFTYQEMAQQVQGLAAGLSLHGLCSGERVAILSENRPEWVIAYLAIVTAGGTAVPLDYQMMETEVMTLLTESRSRMVVASSRTVSGLRGLPSSIQVIFLDSFIQPPALTYEELLSQGLNNPMPAVTVRANDVASLLYTSGTTGTPKGVLLTHGNLLANARAMMSSGLAGDDDNFLVMLPLHHAYPFMIACLVPLLLGAKLTFLQSLKAPDLVQCLRETQVTMVVGVPQVFAMIRRAIVDQFHRRPFLVRTMLSSLLVMSGLIRQGTGINVGRVIFRAVHQRFGGSIRMLCSGGATLDGEVIRDFERLGFTIRQGYGLTETAPVVSFTPMVKPKFGSVGIPIPGVEVKIVNPNPEGVGEVAMKGPNVMNGYDRNPEATAEAIRDGWFHTGDLGYLDQEGYLFLTGRVKELIVTSGGKNIYPEELEKRFETSPAIREICLMGTKDSKGEGEGIHAIILPDFDFLKSQKVPDVRRQIKDELTRIGLTLPSYARITQMSIVKEPLPRTRLGKIQRHRVLSRVKPASGTQEEPAVFSESDQALLATALAQKVIESLKTVLPKAKPIQLDDHLDLDLGLDSLRRVELVVALEQHFGPLPENLGMEVSTVRDVMDHLKAVEHGPLEEGATREKSWHDLLQVEFPLEQIGHPLRTSGFGKRLAASVFRLGLWLVFRLVFHLSVKGKDHLPRDESFLLAGNHVSYLDPFVILSSIPPSMFERLLTLGWEPYFRGWFRSWVGRIGHVIPIGPDTSFVTLLQISSSVLRHGKSLLIFPEGERSIDGQLLPFRKGIGILACETEVPVVPVWIDGTYQVLPAGKRWPRRHPITLQFGNPCRISPDLRERWKREGADVYPAATQMIREQVVELGKRVGS